MACVNIDSPFVTWENGFTEEEIDEIGLLGYLGTVFETELAFDNIGMEIQLNPKFDMINHEVIAVEGGIVFGAITFLRSADKYIVTPAPGNVSPFI